MTVMADVADDPFCWFCSATNYDWSDGGWAACHDCGAMFRYSRRLGEIVDTEPPQSLDVVSDLLHKLRRGDL